MKLWTYILVLFACSLLPAQEVIHALRHPPAVSGAAIRCHGSGTWASSSSPTLTISGCLTAGDGIIVFVGAANQGNYTTANQFPIAGYAWLDPQQTSQPYWTGFTVFHEVTSADVSSGTLGPLSFIASGIGDFDFVEFNGLPNGFTSSGETTKAYVGASPTSSATPTTYAVVPGDTVFWWGTTDGTVTASGRGTLLENPDSHGKLYSEVVSSSSAGLTGSWTYSGTNVANNVAVIVHNRTSPDLESVPGLEIWGSAGCTSRTGQSCSTPGSTTNLSTWVNRYGGENPAMTVSTGTCQWSSGVVNSQPSVSFSSCAISPAATNSFNSSASMLYALTFVAVWKNASTSADGVIFGSGSAGSVPGGPAYATCKASPKVQQGMDAQNVSALGAGTDSCDTNWHQGSGSYTNGTYPTFRLDGASDTTQNFGTNTLTRGPSIIGRNDYAISEYLNATMPEFAMYSTQLTASDYTLIENYFNTNYGFK